jgi:hypothetical protein
LKPLRAQALEREAPTTPNKSHSLHAWYLQRQLVSLDAPVLPSAVHPGSQTVDKKHFCEWCHSAAFVYRRRDSQDVGCDSLRLACRYLRSDWFCSGVSLTASRSCSCRRNYRGAILRFCLKLSAFTAQNRRTHGTISKLRRRMVASSTSTTCRGGNDTAVRHCCGPHRLRSGNATEAVMTTARWPGGLLNECGLDHILLLLPAAFRCQTMQALGEGHTGGIRTGLDHFG